MRIPRRVKIPRFRIDDGEQSCISCIRARNRYSAYRRQLFFAIPVYTTRPRSSRSTCYPHDVENQRSYDAPRAMQFDLQFDTRRARSARCLVRDYKRGARGARDNIETQKGETRAGRGTTSLGSGVIVNYVRQRGTSRLSLNDA